MKFKKVILTISLFIFMLFITSCSTENNKCEHNYEVTERVYATCDVEGKRVFTCSKCNDSFVETLNKMEHLYRKVDEKIPTCENDGEIIYKCLNCDDQYSKLVEKIGHNFINGKCQHCGENENKNPQDCEHEYTIIESILPTCQADGEKIYKCDYCNKDYYEIIDKVDHEYVNGECKYCNKAENVAPEDCDHEYIKKSETKSTCIKNGFIEYECSNCKNTYKDEKELASHEYEAGFCVVCNVNNPKYDGSVIYDVFGEDTNIYEVDERNPYGIDLSRYGDNVSAVFYTPNYGAMTDPYLNVSFNDFYNNYSPATSVEDAYYRSKHYYISGDITEQGHIPPQSEYTIDGSYVRCTTALYILSTKGEYLGYVPNSINSEQPYIIYYGAGYQSINDVAAYLLAFGEVPANNKYDKNQGKSSAIDQWGIYGRVNNSSFSGDTSKYPYEPKLPGIGTLKYIETDFGTKGGYVTSNSITGTYYNQGIYNNGKSITRGAARFVFVTKASTNRIDDRYVFYTYNHYNDFQEYLNYNDGFGLRFGNQSAGNEYCGSTKDYTASNKYPITLYPQTVLKKYEEIGN